MLYPQFHDCDTKDVDIFFLANLSEKNTYRNISNHSRKVKETYLILIIIYECFF